MDRSMAPSMDRSMEPSVDRSMEPSVDRSMEGNMEYDARGGHVGDAPSESSWSRSVSEAVDKLRNMNGTINRSTFGRVFRLQDSGHPEEIADANFATEIRAGLTTFATMAYIIAVNVGLRLVTLVVWSLDLVLTAMEASILSDSGATCVCHAGDTNCNPDDYETCLTEIQHDFITATAALAGLSSIVFGFLTNMPVALAPGMGLNAYFTYQVVGADGTGPVSYRLALTAVFVEGFIFMFLALTGMRQWLVRIIPGTIKTASGVGIGMFLCLVGLSYNSGIGLITPGGTSTPLSLGGCPSELLNLSTGACNSGSMTNPKMWLGIIGGGIFTAWLMAFRVKSAIVLGMLFVTIISWPRNTAVSYFPYTEEGDARWEFFKRIVTFEPIKHTLGVQQWNLSGNNGPHFALALLTFLYVDIIDCTATLYSMARYSGRVRSSDGDFPRSTIAYCIDAAFISIGALFGCSPVTAFVESGAGIAEGGRTGLTAIVTGLCFLISVFFAPVFSSIPPWATGCTLVLVGCLMMRQVTCVNWSYIGDAVPSFVTIAFIPFSYSVAYGLMAGLFVYTVLNSLIWFVIWASSGAIEPREYDLKEVWTWKPVGKKPWLFSLFSRHKFWEARRNTTPDEGLVLHDIHTTSVHAVREGSLQGVPLGSATSAEEKGAEVTEAARSISTLPRAVVPRETPS